MSLLSEVYGTGFDKCEQCDGRGYLLVKQCKQCNDSKHLVVTNDGCKTTWCLKCDVKYPRLQCKGCLS